MNKPKYYQNYHKHDSYSHRYNKDSPLTHMDYLKYIDKNFKDNPQIFSTVAHGWQSAYFDIYNDLEKFNKNNNTNIKFIFGTEAYWVKDRFEKDNSNCHIILLAKNENGRKAINKAISTSFKTGYYYKARMDLDLLLSLPPKDVFVTTACVAFWNKYNDIDDIVLKLNNHFESFYLEVQAHHTEKQKKVNEHILELHKQYNIPIIAATDSHVLIESQMEDREDLLRSNKIVYEDEFGWFMDYPTLDVFIDRFEKQGVLSTEQIYQAIENTNIILDFEDIILDRSLKVPVIKEYKNKTQDERNEIFKQIVNEEWEKQIYDIDISRKKEYIEEIRKNVNEIISCNMADYFIFNYSNMKLGIEKYGGILTPTGRGSAVAMLVNKILGFTGVDKMTSPVIMYPERFLTKERVLESHTPPDIDHNCADRQPFIKAQIELLGDGTTYDLLAVGTLKYKSAFKMYSRAHNLEPSLANEVSQQITKYEKALRFAEEDEKDTIDIYDYVDKEAYGELIEGCKQYMGIVDNLKGHPCAVIAYDGDVESDIGVILCKSETTGKEVLTAVIGSGAIDSFGYLKQDYLIVDSIGLASDIYKEVGVKPLTINELLKTINGDKKVWDIYANGETICVNQCEQPNTIKKVMKYKPQNISELTQFVAAIRPAFKSMYHIYENRKPFSYGIETFDKLIQDEYSPSSFILYQEHLMKVLEFSGFPIKDTYTIIKAISKKKHAVIQNTKEQFIENFSHKLLEDYGDMPSEDVKERTHDVWIIVEDNASYGFCAPHAYCMALDSVTLAYLKAYYPLEFYKAALQRYTAKGDKDKVSLLKKELLKKGIQLKPLKYRDDNREFSIDKENNAINQTLSSIKKMPSIVAQELYDIKDEQFSRRSDFYKFILENKNINKTALDILIKLDYFSEFGEINQMLYELETFKKYYSSKTFAKKSFNQKEIEYLRLCGGKETEKQFKDIDNIKFIQLMLGNEKIETTQLDKMLYEIKILGYTMMIDKESEALTYIVEDIEINSYGTIFAKLYSVLYGVSNRYKVSKMYFNKHNLKPLDVIDVAFKEQYKKRKIDDKWVETDEKEVVLNAYHIKRREVDES